MMTEPKRLTGLLESVVDPDRVVAIRDNNGVTMQDFQHRVADWQVAAEQQPAAVFGVYMKDTFEFAAALFGLWYAGKTALLMGDRLPATIEQIKGRVGALAGNFDEPLTLPVIRQPEAASRGKVPRFPALDRAHPAVIVLTSGSTGTPKLVPMALAQLDDEVAMHEAQWGQQAGQSAVIGTVSHQHIYGLLWRLLWPLAGDRPFVSELCQYAEDALAHASRLPSSVLVTTPSHLSRWPCQPGEKAEGNWRLVVSSTAPLALEHSVFGRDYFGVPVTEIFGSSETGGIAWRQQTEDEVWSTLKGIEVDCDPESRALLLQSPLLGHQDWLKTGDRAEVFDRNRFRLLGRLDRIAKIEGKRVSLTRMESRLTAHPRVTEARVVVLEGRRTETAVVAALDESGQRWLETEGKRAVSRALRQWLADDFETPVLPRRWRLVDALPRNAQGKVPQRNLMALFDKSGGTTPEAGVLNDNRLPVLLGQEWLAANQVQLHLRVQPELAFFQGHFDELPVVPGVAQIHWAEHYARALFNEKLASRDTFSRMETVKFQELIRPGREVFMELTLQPERSRFVFRLHDGDTAFSSGRMVFDALQEPI